MRTSTKIILLTTIITAVSASVGTGVFANRGADAMREDDTAETVTMTVAEMTESFALEEETETSEEATEVTTQTTTTAQTTTTVQTTTTQETTAAAPAIPKVEVKGLTAEADSVSSLKITWDAEEGQDYSVSWEALTACPENATFIFPEGQNGVCYLTGLRIDTEYIITVEPILQEDENAEIVPAVTAVRTPGVEVIQEYEYEDGWTGCFAGERASGLTAMPSSGAIYGSTADSVTGTGIRRFENGDYCCAMGTHYGYCNDRFLIELENGIQFTTRICDSKGAASVQDEWGYGKYHWFGGEGNGKCIIEFIYDDASLPSCVRYAGSWGNWNWNGLNLCSNIKSIQKINY